MFPSFCSIFILFYPFHNAGRLDGAQGSLAPSDRWTNRAPETVNAGTIRLDVVELHLNRPALLTPSLENPCSARKEGQRSRVCTHTALKRNVAFCGLGFSSPFWARFACQPRACSCVSGAGRGWVAGLPVIPKPRYKGGQSTEPGLKLTSPFWSSAVSSEPSFRERMTWNETLCNGGNWASESVTWLLKWFRAICTCASNS